MVRRGRRWPGIVGDDAAGGDGERRWLIKGGGICVGIVVDDAAGGDGERRVLSGMVKG